MSDSLNTLAPETVETAAPPELTTFNPNEPVTETTLEAQEDAERREAFLAPPGEWRGTPLHPWSLDRELLWQDLRRRAGAPSWDEIVGCKDLHAFAPDAIRILYISTLDDDALDAARTQLVALSKQAHAWANEAVGIHGQAEAITAALTIYNHAHATEAELVPEGGGASRGK